MKTQPETDPVCCPKVDPEQWQDKIFDWENKPFVKDSVFTFFFIPLNFGQVMRRLDKKVTVAGATMPDFMCLSDHTSPWNMDVYLAVDKDVPEGKNTTLSGKFYSRVYEGPFKNTSQWCKDHTVAAKDKGFNVKKWLMWYTTCPKCAKKYGKNYVVIFSQVETTDNKKPSA